MEDHLRLVSVVYESDVNITALGRLRLTELASLTIEAEYLVFPGGPISRLWNPMLTGIHTLVISSLPVMATRKCVRDGNTDSLFGKRIEDCTDPSPHPGF